MKASHAAGMFVLWAFVAGVFIGGTVVFVVLESGVHEVTAAADRAIAAAGINETAHADLRRAAQGCLESLTEQNSAHTLLVEDATQNPQITLRAGDVSMLSLFLQSPNQQSPDHQSVTVEGWYVPAKVKPVAYGRGARRYWYFDPQTKQLQGPFVPEHAK